MTLIIAIFIGFVSVWFPRSGNSWAFYVPGMKAFGGNARAYLDYIYSAHSEQVIYVITEPGLDLRFVEQRYPRVRVVSGFWGVAWARLRSRYVVLTHSAGVAQGYFRFVVGVKIVNVWHGIPIKGMANLDASFQEKVLKKRFYDFMPLAVTWPLKARQWRRAFSKFQANDLLVASSPAERAMLCGCMLIDAEKVKVVGMPRTDTLLKPEWSLPQDCREALDLLDQKANGRAIILYAPTFRDSDNFQFGLNDDELTRLIALCDRLGAVFAIRPHPVEEECFAPIFDKYPAILNLGVNVVADSALLLRKVAVLVSDYSSIWIDFLLTGRPVIAYLWDMESYQGMRGLMYNFSAIFPGDICADAVALERAIVKANTRESLSANELVMRARDFFFTYQDDCNCERLYEAIRRL